MDDAKIARMGVTWLRAALLTQKYSHDKKEAILSGFRLGIPVQALSLMTGYSEEKMLWILRETGDGVKNSVAFMGVSAVGVAKYFLEGRFP